MQTDKTLADGGSRASIATRIRELRSDSARRWGRMSVDQMLCHLTDSYVGAIGERPISPVGLRIPRPILKWLMLNTPWPKSAQSPLEVDAERGGTPPSDFGRDRTRLLDAIDRFCAAPDLSRAPHPLAGAMTRTEWLRWGYLHADHHLRQFGA
jgi:hypothetical protein